MKEYAKEIVAGTVPVLLIFLIFIGVDPIPLLLLTGFGAAIFFMTRMRGKVGINAERQGRKRDISSLTFADIGGQDRAKQELIEALDFLIRQDDIKKMGIRPLKGILLTGPPGTGKTLMAKAAAHYTDSVFASASGSEFIEMYVGVGASRIRDLFKEVRTRAQKENKDRAVVFIDEIDVIGGKREGGSHREYDQTLNQLLTEMDGIHTSDSPRILVLAATNRKEMLDSALLRPGRFDRHIGVDLPDKRGRLHILRIHADNKPLHHDVDLERVAEESFHFSGAQLESLMNEAAIYAMREDQNEIHQQHLSMAVDKVMMGEKTDRETSKEEKRRVALHELGHAIVAEKVRPGSVAQVALSPRGEALGYVRHQPSRDQYLYSKAYIEQQIMIALGGATAEEMYYGERSTGSRNDFEQVLNMVQTMIDSGLTELGIVSREIVPKDKLQTVTKQILDELTEKTRTLLEQYRYVFEESLAILLKEETLSGAQFRELIAKIEQKSSAS